MSKNITIAEGGQAKNFNSVAKLRTNLIGGGTQNWIPEDEAGRYANLGEVSIDENGTYRASDERLDGFSKITVNVPTESGGGGGGHEPRLITKNITANGTYNAGSDGADGYSSVTVNVSYPHGRVIVPGINHAPVSQRINTRNFIEDLNEQVFRVVENTITDQDFKIQAEDAIRNGRWLERISCTDLYNYNNLLLFGGGGTSTQYDENSVYIWLVPVGIMGEGANVTVTNIVPPGAFSTYLYNNNDFTLYGQNYAIWAVYHKNGWTSVSDAWKLPGGVKYDIDNGISGTSTDVRITAMNFNNHIDSNYPYVGPLTNLTGGTIA